MARTKISEFSSNPATNTDIDSIFIGEGMAPSNVNDAIRELMAQLKDFQTGAVGDSFNGPVGTTTAAAGAFTTLAASGAVTLSGGTANGVAYLNGSKVVTSGSALTFDGTNFQVANGDLTLGVGNYKLTANDAYVGFASNKIAFNNSSDQIKFTIAASEQMRLTSTGLGIGTSSPSAKLNVVGSSDMSGIFESTGTSNAASLIVRSGNGTTSGLYAYARFVNNDTNAQDWRIGTYGNNNLSIVNAKAGTTPVVLDSSGNLGLGVTPSAWNSDYKNFAIGTGGGLYGRVSTTEAGIGSNFYRNSGGSYIYLTSAAASYQAQVGGVHYWFNAASGTAGNAITFTQAMSLLANGAWVLGDTAVVASGYAGVKFNGASFNGLGLNDSSASSGVGYIYFQSNGTTIGTITRVGATSAVAYNTSSDYRLKNITGPITTSGAYIDSLNPVEGTWKSDGSAFVGLIAHEVQEASRTQVATGTKDGAEMQGMDYSASELIANLIAEVKSLRQRVATLEAK